MTAVALACAVLVGCTADDSQDDEVDVLAEVLEREAPEVDDLSDDEPHVSPAAGDDGEEPAAPADDGDDGDGDGGDDGGGADAAADAPSTSAGAPDTEGPSTAAPRAGSDGAATSAGGSGSASRPAPAPAPRPAPAADQEGPDQRPAPPTPPSPRTLAPSEVASNGVLSSLDGEWVETSSTVIERDADPTPFVVDLVVSTADEGAQRVSCVPRLAAPDDRGLVARGEILVSVITTTGDEVARQPRVRIPLDVELAAGEQLELPASTPLTVRHGEQDASFSCLAVLTR